MINDQLVEDHERVFVSEYNGRCINPESPRKMFNRFDKTITSHGFRNTFEEWTYKADVNEFLVDRYVDHNLRGLDKAYRRYNTLQGCADLARGYYAYLVTGVTPAARKQPHLKVVA